MAFETVLIHSTRNGGTPINGYRQDLVIGDVIALTLSSSINVSSYQWWILGRPEGSVAGGAGPEPINLGTSSGASFTVDSDASYPKDGSYIVACQVNINTPTETMITGELVRLSGLTTPDGRALRMLGAFEVNQDTSAPSVNQGWATMMNRWLRYLATGGTGDHKVLVDGSDTTAGYLYAKLVDGNGDPFTVLNPGGNEKLQIPGGGLDPNIARW